MLNIVSKLFGLDKNTTKEQFALQAEVIRLNQEIEVLKQSHVSYKNGPDYPTTFNADGLITVHNCDFIKEDKFIQAYDLGMKTGHNFGGDLHIEWRVKIACWAAKCALNLEGDFVECGVNTGILSRAVMSYISFEKYKLRKFYLLDTFSGIPEEQFTPEENKLNLSAHNSMYFDCYDLVVQNFKLYENVKIVRGKVPQTLSAITSEKICYLSIDMNLVYPEIEAAKYLWPKIVKGGMILLDDYGWRPHINQKNAWDKLAEENSLEILPLPTGQGLIIK